MTRRQVLRRRLDENNPNLQTKNDVMKSILQFIFYFGFCSAAFCPEKSGALEKKEGEYYAN